MASNDDTVRLKKYKARGDRRHVQAQRIWMLLVASILCYQKKHGRKNKAVLPEELPTYGELATLMGYSTQAGRTFAIAIGMLGWICVENDLPPINAVVVNQHSRLPGDEVVLTGAPKTHAEWLAEVLSNQLDVLNYDWTRIRPPSTGMMLRIAKKHGMYADEGDDSDDS